MGNGEVKGAAVVEGSQAELAHRRVIAIVAEGYPAARLAKFRADAADATIHLLQRVPALRGQVCVVRIDVASRERGADLPGLPPVDTYFDAAFAGDNLHLLTVDEPRVIDVVDRQLAVLAGGAHVHAFKVIVLVDSGVVGGSGGEALGLAVVSASIHAQVLAHELGHTFGLGDEYPGSPELAGAPNVSRSAARGALPARWRALLSPGVALPTPDDAPAETIGAFPFDAAPPRYRPAHACTMSSTLRPFCAVCEAQIRDLVINGHS
jgi:hypothetical protein